MQGKVEICGVNTSKLKVLKNEETMELLRRTKEGDMEAREQLIAGNLRLVLSVIQKFSNRGENLDDLFQVGCIGLIKAIDNFNTDLDVRFSTYGVPMIIGEIRRYLRDNSSVRVSRSMRDTDSKNTDESWLEHIALKEAMNRLSDRERHILNLRFFEGKTQMEVSAEVGISQAQVSRLEKSAINQIKKNL